MEPLQVAKALSEAFETKDLNKVRSLLHPEYTFKSPSMNFQSPEEAIRALKLFPFKAKNENARYTVQENQVVQIFDWVVREPFPMSVRMCDSLTIKDGKVICEELFYDASRLPKAVNKILEKLKCEK